VILYLAFELSNSKWKLFFSNGEKILNKSIAASHLHLVIFSDGILTYIFSFPLKDLGLWDITAWHPPKRANAPLPNIHIDSSARPPRPETGTGSGGATRLPIKSPILLQTIFQKNPLSVIRPDATYVVVTFSLTHKENFSMVFPHQSKLLSLHSLLLRRKPL